MKPSRLLLLLVCAQVLVALAVAVLCLQQIQATRQFNVQARGLGELSAQVTQNQRALQLLASEAVEYSKRQPAIDPLLVSLNLKVAPTNTPPATPSTPPSSAPVNRAKPSR